MARMRGSLQSSTFAMNIISVDANLFCKLTWNAEGISNVSPRNKKEVGKKYEEKFGGAIGEEKGMLTVFLKHLRSEELQQY